MTSTAPGSSGRFQPPEVRRRQILDAVAALAVRHGLDDVSIARVAEEAGVAKGSIYLHFASRHELISAMQADLWDRMLEAPTRIVEDDSLTWAEKLDRIVTHLVRFEFEQHELYHAIFHATATGAEEPWIRSRELLRRVIGEGARAAEFNVLDLDVTTDFLLHGYTGPCYHRDDADDTAAALSALFRRVVGA